MSVPKLVYFNFGGRAEASRLLFSAGGVQFEDKRITGEELATMKEASELPFGQLPILVVEGRTIAQSGAIVRYAGRLGGIYPTDPFAAAYHDMLYEQTQDIIGTISKTFSMPEEEKLAFRTKLVNEVWPVMFGALDRELTTNGGPFLTGSTISIADCGLVPILEWISSAVLDGIPADAISSRFPGLIAVQTAVYANSGVAAYKAAH